MKKNLLALIIVGLAIGTASAADRYWDPDTDNSTNPNDSTTGANLGGTGTWDTTSLNWWDGTASPAPDIAWTDGNKAIFWGNSSGVVTIPASQTRSATGLTFKTDGYEIADAGTTSATNGVITFSVAPNIVVDPNVKAKITARIGATGYVNGYNVSGGGTLWIAEPTGVTAAATGGANATGGAVSVTSTSAVNQSNFADGNHTILEVIGGGQIGTSGTVGQYPITLNGGTYRDTDATPTGSAFAFTTGTSRNWVIGTNGGVWDVPQSAAILLNGGATVGAGSVSTTGVGTHILYKTGPGEIRMAGVAGQTNTVDKLYIAEGRYTIGQASTLGRDDQLGAVPSSPAAGVDAVTLNGQGTGAILRFNGGSSATTITTNANRGFYLDTTGGSTNTFQVNETNATIPGLISGPGGFIKTGSLILTLNNASGNTYVGPTTVSGGLLKLMSTNTSTGSRVSSGLVTVGSGAALSLEYDSTIGGNSPQPEAPGGVSISSGGNLAGNGILGGALTVASGGKVTPGIGGANAVLTVPNADFSTGVILQSTLGNTNSSDVLKVTTASTGLNLNGGLVSLIPVGTTNPAGQSYTLIDYTTGYTGNVNTLLINNQTGFDGTTIVDDPTNHVIKAVVGTVVTDRTWIRESDFGNWNSDAPPGPNESANWAKPDNTTPATAANGVGAIARFPAISPITSNAIGSQTVTISDVNKTLGTLVLDNPNSFTFAPGIAGLRLTMQTYTGNALIDVKQGTHTITTPVTLTSPTNINLAANTTLTFTSNPVTNTGGLTVDTAAGSTLTTVPITNTGGFTKTGPGTVSINTNDWTGTGATNINGGTLRYTSDNAPGLGNSSTVTIAAGATLDFNSNNNQSPGGGLPSASGVSDTIGALAGAGSLINNRNLTINGTNSTPVVFSGTIGISSALGGNDFFSQDATHQAITRTFTKTGTGSQTISGQLEATGNFTAATVSGGTLILNNPINTSLTTSTGTMTVSGAGTTLGGTGYIAGPVTISAGSVLSPGSGGVGTLHLTNTGAAALTVAGIASGTPSALSMELKTNVSNVDSSDLVDVSTGTLATGTLAVKPRINLVNGGTMTGGTYTLIDYGTLTGNGLSLNTVPAGFIAELNTNTVATTIEAIVEFVGDFNNDNAVDASDYVIWKKNNGATSTSNLFTRGDANGDKIVNSADYDLWRANFGKSITPAGSGSGLASATVPEPTALLLAVLGVFATGIVRRRR